MEDLTATFKNNRLALVVLIVLLVAIPLTIYLVRQQQILKSRANESSITFTGPNVSVSNGVFTANAPDIQVQLHYEPHTTVPTATPTTSATGITIKVSVLNYNDGYATTVPSLKLLLGDTLVAEKFNADDFTNSISGFRFTGLQAGIDYTLVLTPPGGKQCFDPSTQSATTCTKTVNLAGPAPVGLPWTVSYLLQ